MVFFVIWHNTKLLFFQRLLFIFFYVPSTQLLNYQRYIHYKFIYAFVHVVYKKTGDYVVDSSV